MEQLLGRRFYKFSSAKRSPTQQVPHPDVLTRRFVGTRLIGMHYSALLSKYSVTNTEQPASAGSKAVVTVMGEPRRAAAMIAAAHRIAFVIWSF